MQKLSSEKLDNNPFRHQCISSRSKREQLKKKEIRKTQLKFLPANLACWQVLFATFVNVVVFFQEPLELRIVFVTRIEHFEVLKLKISETKTNVRN